MSTAFKLCNVASFRTTRERLSNVSGVGPEVQLKGHLYADNGSTLSRLWGYYSCLPDATVRGLNSGEAESVVVISTA